MDEEGFCNLAAAAAACIYIKEKAAKAKRQKRRLVARKKQKLLNTDQELPLKPWDSQNYLRMDTTTYNNLLQMVNPLIKKKDTTMKQAISPHDRLSATLRYLATGCTYEDLKVPTRISAQALGKIIPDTCRAILRCLQGYLKMPNTAQEWKAIARQFEDRWNFPHCLGACVGKHIRIIPPHGSGSYFYNHKQFNSIVLIACVNANYEFIWVEVGTNGQISDGSAFENTEFYEKMNSDRLNLPPPEPLSDDEATNLPYVFVGDEAFTLRNDLMKPFSQKTLTKEQKNFNCHLSEVRGVIENAFKLMSIRFRILRCGINLSLDKIDLVVLTCCVLHNFLRKNCSTYTVEETEKESQNSTYNSLISLQVTDSQNSSTSANRVREMFKEYFVGQKHVL